MKSFQDGRRREDARLRKRVRTLESRLGYSNLAFEGLQNNRLEEEANNPLWQNEHFEPPGDHRKRRLSRVPGSALQIEVANSRSVPALSPRPAGQSPLMWTQPVNHRDVEARRSLPRLAGPSQKAEISRDFEMPGEKIEIATLGGCMLPEPCDERGQLLEIQDPKAVLSPRHLRNSRRSESCFPGQALTLNGPEHSDADRVNFNQGANQVRCKGLQEEAASPVPFGAVSEKVGNESRKLVGKRLQKRLRTVRAGRCRSLVSPNNPFTSNMVVARVKQGLNDGIDENRPKVLIVGSGTFNPVHKIHIRRFYLARKFLETHKGMRVVGGIVSPSHPTLVRQRHRVRAAEIIPSKHRLYMARAAVGEGSWLAVDPWEVTRKRIMDYMSVLEHAKEVCHETFPGHAGDITILYMCQASQIHHLNPVMLRAGGFGVITVCRPLEKERLLTELSPSFRNIAILVEDATILSAELEKTSSNMARIP
ncbi:unnamed protein product, partial [Scytosiphon promiscuus]